MTDQSIYSSNGDHHNEDYRILSSQLRTLLARIEDVPITLGDIHRFEQILTTALVTILDQYLM